MDNQKVNWRDVESFFLKVFRSDEYDQFTAEQLAFCVSQLLEDSAALIESINKGLNLDDHDTEVLIENVHALLNNHELAKDGHRLLMREDWKR